MAIVEKLNLLDEFLKEFKKEIVGEENTIKTLTLVFISKYLIDRNNTSFHTLLNSNSGAGKDFILNKFIKLYDPETCENYTRISARALDYLHTSKQDKETNFSWQDKYLCLHDIEETILNSSTLKLFLSDGTKTAIVQDGMVRIREVNGVPIVVMTSAYSDPNKEQLRRINLINLNETPEQTQKILSFEPEEKINYDYLKKILSQIKHYEVIVPFKKDLALVVCSEDIFMRTFFKKIIDFIKASCVLNQHRRKKDKKKLVAEEEDYEIAREIINNMSHFTGFKPISLYKKKFLNNIKDNFDYNWFNVKDVESVTGLSYEGVRKNLSKLFDDSLLDSRLNRDGYKPIIEYSLKEDNKIQLPTFDQIKSITTKTTKTTSKTPIYIEKQEKEKSCISFNSCIGCNSSNSCNTFNIDEKRFYKILDMAGEMDISDLIKQGFPEEYIKKQIKDGNIFENKSGRVRLLK